MDELVTKHSAIMNKYDPDKRVALYVDEWGTWYDQEPGSHPGFLYQQNSLRDAEVAALTLNIFHRHTDRVKLAARSEEHTSELQSLMRISYAVFCLKKKMNEIQSIIKRLYVYHCTSKEHQHKETNKNRK